MARPNPNIPLQVKSIDAVTPLLSLRARGEETRRQNTIDQSNLKTAGLQQENLGLRNDAARQNVQAGQIQAIAMDTLAARRLLEASTVNPELRQDVGMLFAQQINRMEELGAPTDQAERLALLADEDPEAAMEFMDKHTIPTLKAKMPQLFEGEVLSDSDVTEQGQVVTRDPISGVVRAQDVQGFAKESEDLTILDQVMEDGTIRTIQSDGKGKFFSMSGKKIDIPDDARLVRSTLTGNQDELGLSDSEFKELRDQEVAAKTFIASAGDAIDLLESAPDVNTFVASAARVVNNIQQEAKAAGRALGMDIDSSLLDPESYSQEFDRLGIQNQQVKGLITSLAFQAAAASGQSGREVSNRDVTRFIEEVGGSAADPRAFAQSIRDVAARTDRAFRINHETRIGPFEGDLGLGSLEREPEETDLSSMSDEEFMNMLNAPVGQ